MTQSIEVQYISLWAKNSWQSSEFCTQRQLYTLTVRASLGFLWSGLTSNRESCGARPSTRKSTQKWSILCNNHVWYLHSKERNWILCPLYNRIMALIILLLTWGFTPLTNQDQWCQPNHHNRRHTLKWVTVSGIEGEQKLLTYAVWEATRSATLAASLDLLTHSRYIPLSLFQQKH